MNKSRMRWTGHVARMGARTGTYSYWAHKAEWRPLGKIGVDCGRKTKSYRRGVEAHLYHLISALILDGWLRPRSGCFNPGNNPLHIV
jgi:hypothetical protein